MTAEKADEELRDALRRDPDSGAAHLYLGNILAELDQRVEAAAYLDRAAKLLPDDDRPAKAMKTLQ